MDFLNLFVNLETDVKEINFNIFKIILSKIYKKAQQKIPAVC